MTAMAEALTRASSRLATNPAAALKEADRLLAVTPSDPRARLLAGMAARRLGETARAIDILADMAREQPLAFHVHLELGLAQAATDDLEAARLDLNRAVALRPDAHEGWIALWDADPDDEPSGRCFDHGDQSKVQPDSTKAKLILSMLVSRKGIC